MTDNKIREAVQFLSEGDKASVINYYNGFFYSILTLFDFAFQNSEGLVQKT